MPARRKLTTRHLRGSYASITNGRQCATLVRVTGIARMTIPRALQHSKAAGLVSPFREAMTDNVLEARSSASTGTRSSAGVRKHPEPNWAELASELKRPAVTLLILWEDCRKGWPEAMGNLGFASFTKFSNACRRL